MQSQSRIIVTVLGLVGGAPGGETPRVADSSAAARAASFITAYLLLSRTASAKPPEQCATFARSINLSRDFPRGIGASVIDLLANSKMRVDSVKRMTQIQNTS